MNSRRRSQLLLIILLVAHYSGFGQCAYGTTGNELGDEYVLVWSDEFSEDGAVCSENWFHQTQLPSGGSWFNGELQHYTDELANSSVSDGILKIKAIKEQYTDQGRTKSYTSARLNSKFAFTYGRIDVRAKLPSGAGTWPAIWMLGRDITESGGYWASEYGATPWPAVGEIDIMEHWGNNPNVIHGSLHTTSSHGATFNTGKTTIPNVSSQFHVYSTIWDSEKIQFLVNDVAYYTYSPAQKDAATWPFDKPQYFLLNIAMGGIGGTIDPNFTSSSMEIDYIRVYQKEGGDSTTDPEASSPEVAALAPEELSGAVLSIFGDTFSNAPVDSWFADGSEGSYQLATIDGSEVIKYDALGTAKIEVISNQLNISGMSHLHMDIWSPNSTSLEIGLLDYGSNGLSDNGVGDDSFSKATFATQAQGQWNSYYLGLSAFPLLNSKSNIAEITLSSNPSGTSVLYIDNIYFVNTSGVLSANEEMTIPTFRYNGDELAVIFSTPTEVVNYQLVDLSGKVLHASNQFDGALSELIIPIKTQGLQIVIMETDQGVLTQKFSL